MLLPPYPRSKLKGVNRQDAPSESESRDAAILRKHGLELDPVIEAYKKDVDRTLLRQNLQRTPNERWSNFIMAMRLAEEIRQAGAKSRGR
jgi:hypothetical protein